MIKNITLTDIYRRKVSTLSELYGLDFTETIEKLVDDALAREYPEQAKREQSKTT